jgi:cell division protein FtsW (lipid II flippase)
MGLAALFLFLYSISLTLASAARVHTWETSLHWMHWIGFFTWLISYSFLHHYSCRSLPDRDSYILPITALLTGWGLLTIWRLSEAYGLRQTIWLVVVVILFRVITGLPRLLNILQRYKYLWLTAGLILTTLTLIFGTYPGGEGPGLWLGCCGVFFQPSELLKFLLIIYLAAYLADQIPASYSFFRLLVPTLILLGISLVILIFQRDLGTAFILISVYTTVLYLATGKRRILLISALGIIIGGFVGYYLFDVVRLRVDAWINPWIDPSGRSYQIVQSILAVAAGGVFGRGPGLGNPSIVPVSQSDFIFTSIAEENGLIGTLAIIILLAILAIRGLKISIYASNRYQKYLVAGLSAHLIFQSILIISGNLRFLPLTGVTLPFVSYGGSSLLTSFLSLSIICIISDQSNNEPKASFKLTPYFWIGTVTLLSLGMIALLNGWWGVIRAPVLLARTDNLRPIIADLYTPRGGIFDRSGIPLVVSTGTAGSIIRKANYPPLSTTVGYTHWLYGQSGLEESLTPYLQGLSSPANLTQLYYEIFYSQHPPGFDIHISIDLALQRRADSLLGSSSGAVVLVNAQTGELLVVASHPYYDSNLLDEKLEAWLQDPRSPLLNRVIQGQYPPGTALAPFLLANIQSFPSLPELPPDLNFQQSGLSWECATQPSSPINWNKAISSGCPGTLIALTKQTQILPIADLYSQFGFMQSPNLPLSTTQPSKVPFLQWDKALLSLDDFTLSPLQMVLAVASFSQNGSIPQPRIVLTIESPDGTPINYPIETVIPPTNLLPASARLNQVTQFLKDNAQPIWHILGKAHKDKVNFTWYLAGTTQEWESSPYALVVILEEDNPVLAEEIGASILQAVMQK